MFRAGLQLSGSSVTSGELARPKFGEGKSVGASRSPDVPQQVSVIHYQPGQMTVAIERV
jgi:hypothetical protein